MMLVCLTTVKKERNRCTDADVHGCAEWPRWCRPAIVCRKRTCLPGKTIFCLGIFKVPFNVLCSRGSAIGQNQCTISYSLYVYKVIQVIAAVNPWVDPAKISVPKQAFCPMVPIFKTTTSCHIMRGLSTYYTDPLTTRDKKYLPMIQVSQEKSLHILLYLFMLLLQYKCTCVLTKRP